MEPPDAEMSSTCLRCQAAPYPEISPECGCLLFESSISLFADFLLQKPTAETPFSRSKNLLPPKYLQDITRSKRQFHPFITISSLKESPTKNISTTTHLSQNICSHSSSICSKKQTTKTGKILPNTSDFLCFFSLLGVPRAASPISRWSSIGGARHVPHKQETTEASQILKENGCFLG